MHPSWNQVEGHPFQHAAHFQVAGPKHGRRRARRRHRLLVREGRSQRAADDEFNNFLIGNLVDPEATDVRAVTQDRHARAKLADLLNTVRNKYDRRSALPHLLYDVAQPLNVGSRKRGGRLVKKKDARIAMQRAYDLNLLPKGKGPDPDFRYGGKSGRQTEFI